MLLCWNDGSRVLRLLERLATCDPAPRRVFVVDNGSTDGSCERIAAANPSVEVVQLGRNSGFAAAANIGIDRALDAGAEWIWLLNTDIDLPADALASLCDCASQDVRMGMAAPVLTWPDGRVQARGGTIGRWTAIARHSTDAGQRVDYLTGACLLLRAAMLREIGTFDERYFFSWEDIDLCARAKDAGWRLAIADGCRVAHEEGSSLGSWSYERWYHLSRGMIRYARSRSAWPAITVAARLVHHTASMIAHGRLASVAGAWSAAVDETLARDWSGAVRVATRSGGHHRCTSLQIAARTSVPRAAAPRARVSRRRAEPDRAA